MASKEIGGHPPRPTGDGKSPKQRAVDQLLELVVDAERLAADVQHVRWCLEQPWNPQRLQMALLAVQLSGLVLLEQVSKMAIKVVGEDGV